MDNRFDSRERARQGPPLWGLFMQTLIAEPARQNASLLSVQVLRGIAAVLVVMHHAGRAVTVHWPTQWPKPSLWLFSSESLIAIGAVGVDIFFVISGFIMVLVSSPYRSGAKPPRDFLIRRLIRIYPMYALTTLSLVAMAAVHFYRHRDEAFSFSAARIIDALAFIPSFNEKGLVQPILGQGWTLFYEMFFYLCFTIVLTFSKRHLLLPLVATFGTTLIVTRAIGAKDSAILTFLSDTIIIEFLFGCAVGLLFQRDALHSRLRFVTLGFGVAGFATSLPFGMPEDLRFLIWGVPASLLLISFLQFEKAHLRWPHWLLVIGNASYSIYLLHVYFVYQLRDIIVKSTPRLAALSGDALLIGLSIVAVALGTAVYLLVERHINAGLNGAYRGLMKTTMKG